MTPGHITQSLCLLAAFSLGACSKETKAPEQGLDAGSEIHTDVTSSPDSSAPKDAGSRTNVFVVVPEKTVGNPVHVSQQPIAFTDVSQQVGLSDLGAQSVAFVDYDLDGWPDITANTYEGLVIYRNVGGTFVDGTAQIIDGDPKQLKWSTGLVYADLDGDGDLDLYAAQMGARDQILLNDGQGRLKLSSTNGLPDNTSTYSVTVMDLNQDGALDLYTAIGLSKIGDPPDRPYGKQGAPNHLLLNAAPGFEDVTSAWNAVAGATSETYASLFVDFDRDGDLDAFIVRDYAPEHFLENTGGIFKDVSEQAIGDDPTSGMGLAVGDINGDGHLDVYGTNNEADLLFLGNGKGVFDGVYEDSVQGGDPTATIKGWGCALVDLDHDGDQDVVEVASYDFQGAYRIGGYAVMENNGKGQLTDITGAAGMAEPVDGWGLAVADFDRDGDFDVLTGLTEPAMNYPVGPDPSTLNTGVRLWRNDSARAAGNQFLQLLLRQPKGNQFAVGAIVDVTVAGKKTSRVVTAGSSYQSAHSYVLHFGLGPSSKADEVRITWPNGTQQTAHNVPAGAHRYAPTQGPCCHSKSDCSEDHPACATW